MKYNTYFCDIDGTVFKYRLFDELQTTTVEIIESTKDLLVKWYNEGHRICFFTSRTEEHRAVTEIWLQKNGFQYHHLLMNKPRGGNYHWIDNHIVRATRYNGVWSPLTTKKVDIQVFEQ